MRVGYRTGDMWAPKLDERKRFAVEGEHFVDCIEQGSRRRPTADSGLRVVELIEAATSSMRGRGETVHHPAQGKSRSDPVRRPEGAVRRH